MSETTSTRRRRTRRTRFGVRVAEVVSRLLITVGGVGTILAVTLIFVFLASVVVPLFGPARLGGAHAVAGAPASPLHVIVDEYGQAAALLHADGSIAVVRLDDGSRLQELRPFGEQPPTVVSFTLGSESAVFGFADGRVRLGLLGFRTRFLSDAEVQAIVPALGPGERTARAGRLVERTLDGRHRELSFAVELDEPAPLADGSALRLLDHTGAASRSVVAALDADGVLHYAVTRQRRNLLTGKTTTTLEEHRLAYDRDGARGPPAALLLSEVGDNVFLVWDDGLCLRLDVRDPAAPSVAEIADLLPDTGAQLTALDVLLGQSSLLVGDSLGTLSVWFRTRPPGADTLDGNVLAMARTLSTGGEPVDVVRGSPRSRLAAAGRRDGTVELFHATTGERVVHAVGGGRPVTWATVTPKEDGLLVLDEAGLRLHPLDPGHPEVSFASLFLPVWYEGHPGPAHVWQSSSGTDEFEPKFGLVPLVFGTLKATFYSLLFGAPLALLAALYTSEFLTRRLRTPVKSAIEMMASLPSVVLGFLAALVIAPFVQSAVPALLAVFVTLPVALLLGAYLWQLLPQQVVLRLAGLPRLCVMAVALALGIAAGFLVGPRMEGLFFDGDLLLWLDGRAPDGGRSPSTGGWLLLLLPVCALVVALASGRLAGPWLRATSAHWERGRSAVADLARFVVLALLSYGLAFLLAHVLDGLGLDPRGELMGTYVQRNALVVGFVMGFAIIPIIYTLAEDALSSVPEHLRLASLGAGATPWQTAVRVIVPTAMSGLFSALMIGLGRAVGETMIVLMATGNTPVMELNVFNGFRTLSANIAVELPEAARGSTHYRTLFLAALVLFAMTFVLNTAAESVRQRFRRRAWQL